MIKLILFILFPLIIYSQIIRGRQPGTGYSTKNVYNQTQTRALIGDSLANFHIADTTTLKARNLTKGRTAFLKQLSATDSSGGGLFIVVDSTYYEDGFNVFNHPLDDTHWRRFVDKGTWYVHASMTDAQIQNTFNNISIDSIATLKIFDETIISTSTDFTIKNIYNLTMDLDNVLWNFGGDKLEIWCQNTATPSVNDFVTTTIWEDNTFLSILGKDSIRVQITDSTDFDSLISRTTAARRPIKEWDMLMLRDSDGLANGVNRGVTFHFDKFDTSGGNQYMYFKERLHHTVDKDCLDTGLQWAVPSGDRVVSVNNANLEDVQIDIAGMGNVFIDNVSIKRNIPDAQRVYPYSADSLNWAIQAKYCNNIFVNNYNVANYIKDGGGYGISVQRCYRAFINNMHAIDCRHAFTNSNQGYMESAQISNSSASYTHGFDGIYDAWDTHANLLDFSLSNVTARDAGEGFGLRGRRIKLDGCQVYNTATGISLNAEEHAADDTSKYIVDITDFKAEASRFIGINVDDGCKLNRLSVDGFDYSSGDIDGDTDADNQIFLNVQTSAQVDSIIIKNVNFLGSDSSTAADRTFNLVNAKRRNGTGETYPIKYFGISNSHFAKGDRFIDWGDPSSTEIFEVKNTSISHYEDVIYATATGDTSYVNMERISFDGCTFETIKNVINFNNDDYYIEDVFFNDNYFNGVSNFMTGVADFRNDLFSITNNRIKNSFYSSNYAFNPANGSYLNFIMSDNIFFPRDETYVDSLVAAYGSETVAWAGASNVSIQGMITVSSVAKGLPEFTVKNNTFMELGSAAMIVALDGIWTVIDNTFKPDSIGHATYNTAIKVEGANSKLKLFDNEFFLVPNATAQAGSWYGLLTRSGHASELWIDGNYFEGDTLGTSQAIYIDNGATVHLGRESGYNWDTFYSKHASATADTLQSTN
jgi:hypothetical protein